MAHKKFWLVPRCMMLQLFLLLIIPTKLAMAHTEDAVVQLSQVPVGPYEMTVWAYPGIMRAGSIHYTVFITDVANAEPLDNATILIEATPLSGRGDVVSANAVQGSDGANPSFYETDLALKEEGIYQIRIVVQDLSEQMYTQQFQIEVVSIASLKIILSVFSIITVVIIVWFVIESLQTWGLNGPLVKNKEAWVKTQKRIRSIRQTDL